MDAYMRENKIEDVVPKFPLSPPQPKSKKSPVMEGEAAPVAPAPTQEAPAAPAAAPGVGAAPKHTAGERAPVSAGRRTT